MHSNSILKGFEKQHILVIGETIVDRYNIGTAIGKSSEAPVIVIKEQETIDYLGGAAIVARHINSLGGQCSFISVIGEDLLGETSLSILKDEGIDATLFGDSTRPTILKQRFIADNQKLLRTSRLKEHFIDKEIENNIIDKIKQYKDLSGIVISDFNYGVITKRVINFIREFSEENNIKTFGDTQSSSQIGDCKQFKEFYLITPTEKEARIALTDEQNEPVKLCRKLIDKTNCKNICLTMGSEGLIAINEKEETFIPALNKHREDSVGAGDALLAAMALSLCSGLGLPVSARMGAITASIAIGKRGNVPVTIKELEGKLCQN